MSLVRYAVCFGVVAVLFGALDFLWLSLAGPHLYRPALGPLLADKVRGVPAAAFYLIYVAGLVGFAVAPSLQNFDWKAALVRAAGLGFVAYAAYDLTNQATLRVWPVRVTLADMAWGTVASGLASAAATALVARAVRAFGWS